jgi:hypothetical protein
MFTFGSAPQASGATPLTASPSARSAAISQLATVKAQQATVSRAITSAKLPVPGLKEIYRVQRVLNGILYQTDGANMAALRALPGVKSVHVVYP